MAAPPRSFEASEYTVACICPSGIELAPVLAMFDYEHSHPALPTKRGQNAYSFGSISQHNVVVAVLPETGNNAAATVATQLINDFPSVRFALLVGTGGGVPWEEEDIDIRLGDVVISQSKGASAAVIQYDLGKRLPDSRFERIGQLNKPPAVLSANVQKLEAQHRISGSKVLQYLSDAVEHYPWMEAQYSYPSSEQDQLFLACYMHQEGRACSNCDRSQTITRPNRSDQKPRVHYGPIGSANLLVKDSALRDSLRNKTGILCIEREAAGLMNAFPCLVIRGICNYADSHQNQSWQPYAAAVAAAYMKELLLTIAPSQVLQERIAKDIVFSDYRTHELLDQGNKLRKRAFDAPPERLEMSEENYRIERDSKCHRAFKTSPYEMYKNNNPDRVSGTCRWVLEHERFRAWQYSTHHDLLWISADPGCGKSVMAKSLVDLDLIHADRTKICYFFFKDNASQNSLATALCAILHQLFDHHPALIQHALPSWHKTKDVICQEVDTMWRIFLAATADPLAMSTICVFDALDECRDDDRGRFISSLCKWYQEASHVHSNAPLKFLVTSRPYDNVQRWFGKTLNQFEIRLRGEHENDRIHEEINLVIRQRISGLASEFQLMKQTQITLQERLLQMKHRTYLWLYLAMEGIRATCRDSIFPDEIHIDSLPKSVEDAYERMLSKIEDKQRSRARKILLIIIGASRPLSIQEMALALGAARAYETDQSVIDPINPMRLENQIRDLCGLFVFVNHSYLFLIHQTAKDFLLTQICDSPVSHQWRSSIHPSEVELEMARWCATYLCLFDKPKPKALFRYCARHWTSHLSDDMLAKDDGQGNTALHWAITYHQYEVAEWLLESGADANASKENKDTPLCMASSMGQDNMVQLLLDNGAAVNAKGCRGTASYIASGSGHESVVKILLTSGANVEADGDNGTALYQASIGCHANVVQVLLDRGADLEAEGEEGSALIAAITRNCEQVIDLLLERGSGVISQDHLNRALCCASARSHIKVVQVLLHNGADVNALTNSDTALYYASAGGSDKVVQMLLDGGANVNAEGHGGTALFCAATRGYENIVRMLLNRGADANFPGKNGSALDAASRRGHAEIVRMLLDQEADVSVSARHIGALEAAVEERNKSVALMLARRMLSLDDARERALGAALYFDEKDLACQLMEQNAMSWKDLDRLKGFPTIPRFERIGNTLRFQDYSSPWLFQWRYIKRSDLESPT